LPSRYHLWISGCQMNNSDARRLAQTLEGAGMVPVDHFEEADVSVLYTCSVRQSAENRVYGQLGHLKSLKARRPGMVLCVTGCMAGDDSAELRRRYPFVDHFVAPADIDQLPARILSSPAVGDSCVPATPQFGSAVPVSAGVTVIRGCNKYCTYCIVPYRRGPQASRGEEEITAEALSLLDRGAKEIVLLGQTVDAWGRDLTPPRPFSGLLRTVAQLPGLARLRFLTSHPEDFTFDIIDAIAELPQLCEELNLPIQAGDNGVLRRMARPYSVAEYLDLVGRIRGAIPEISLSTDIIVGFPGETSAQFENTMKVLRHLEFDVVHVAAYSPRPGTAAARKMTDDVTAEEKSLRLHEVEDLQTAIAQRKNSEMIGRKVEVLVEGRSKGRWSGRTRSNRLVFFDSERELAGNLVNIAVEMAGPWSLQGRLDN
jgi:tRNA-2-methylthio-N6-dimethylallyladenosine synthase